MDLCLLFGLGKTSKWQNPKASRPANFCWARSGKVVENHGGSNKITQLLGRSTNKRIARDSNDTASYALLCFRNSQDSANYTWLWVWLKVGAPGLSSAFQPLDYLQVNRHSSANLHYSTRNPAQSAQFHPCNGDVKSCLCTSGGHLGKEQLLHTFCGFLWPRCMSQDM